MTMGITPSTAPASVPPSTPPAPPSDTCNVPTETHGDKAGQKADLPTADDVIVAGGSKSSSFVLGEQVGFGRSSSTNGGTRGR